MPVFASISTPDLDLGRIGWPAREVRGIPRPKVCARTWILTRRLDHSTAARGFLVRTSDSGAKTSFPSARKSSLSPFRGAARGLAQAERSADVPVPASRLVTPDWGRASLLKAGCWMLTAFPVTHHSSPLLGLIADGFLLNHSTTQRLNRLPKLDEPYELNELNKPALHPLLITGSWERGPHPYPVRWRSCIPCRKPC